MTSDEVLLLLGESVADAIADLLRGIAPEGFERSELSLYPKGEFAFQALPAVGVVSSASYVDGSSGGHVLMMGRKAARKLTLLVNGGEPVDGGEGSLSSAELVQIGEAAARVIDTAAATMEAVLGDRPELSAAKTRAFATPSEAVVGIDMAPRAATVIFTFAGETIRFVHLIPNALLIRLTQVFDDRAAARTLERFVDAPYASVPPDSVREVTVKLRAELGRTRLTLIQASTLDRGAAVTLDRLVHDPVELFVNGRRFGTGELVASGGRWAVRITEVTGVSGSTAK